MFQAVSQIESIQKQAHLGPVVTRDVTKSSVQRDFLVRNQGLNSLDRSIIHALESENKRFT